MDIGWKLKLESKAKFIPDDGSHLLKYILLVASSVGLVEFPFPSWYHVLSWLLISADTPVSSAPLAG